MTVALAMNREWFIVVDDVTNTVKVAWVYAYCITRNSPQSHSFNCRTTKLGSQLMRHRQYLLFNTLVMTGQNWTALRVR